MSAAREALTSLASKAANVAPGQTGRRGQPKERGLALVSEDRRADQVFPGRRVRENLTSAILEALRAGIGYLSPTRQRAEAVELTGQYAVAIGA